MEEQEVTMQIETSFGGPNEDNRNQFLNARGEGASRSYEGETSSRQVVKLASRDNRTQSEDTPRKCSGY